MSTVEKILQEARELSLAERKRLSQLLAEETRAAEHSVREETVRQAMGSMAGLLPSTDAFLADKHAELEHEGNHGKAPR
jgi:hypothetical protein